MRERDNDNHIRLINVFIQKYIFAGEKKEVEIIKQKGFHVSECFRGDEKGWQIGDFLILKIFEEYFQNIFSRCHLNKSLKIYSH